MFLEANKEGQSHFSFRSTARRRGNVALALFRYFLNSSLIHRFIRANYPLQVEPAYGFGLG
jgi:hypothetical protein